MRLGMFAILLVATALMLFASYLSYRRRSQDVAKYCALVMLSASFYAFGYAFEILSTSLEQAKFWLKVQYIGAPFVATFWLLLVMVITGHKRLLNIRWFTLLLFAIPVITVILHYTNDAHHLLYRNIQFYSETGAVSSVHLIKGTWYWIYISYLYLQASIGIGLFLRMYTKASSLVRKQVAVLMLGTLAPWMMNIAYLLSYDYLNIDLTPLGFTLSGFVYLWAIYRFDLLRLVPVAYRTIFETTQDGVVILDYEHRVAHVNPAARETLELLDAFRESEGSALQLFAAYPELVAKIADAERGEVRIAIRQGEANRHFQVKLSTIAGKRGTSLGKLLILHDVTQIVRYQEQLVANAKQLGELHTFKDQLFAVVTHDIRDPLAMLVNLTEIIEEDFIDAESEETRVFQQIGSKVKDTYLLVENILDWFRSQRGGTIHHRPLTWQLEPIVRKTVRVMDDRANAKSIIIDVAVTEGLQVFADKEMLELVLRNLLYNAVKYTDEGGRVHVKADGDRKRVTVSVRDSGDGIDPRNADTLFREVQAGSALGTAGERGTGLGLYLCGRFVELNGGDIWFESEAGRGSTFFFTIPSREDTMPTNRTGKEGEIR